MTDMYRLPPIIPATMEFELPDRMYNLPLIQKSNVTAISNASVEVRKFLDVVHVSVWYINSFIFETMQATQCGRDDQVLIDLERRQEAILKKLASLKLEVSMLKGDKHVAVTKVLKIVLALKSLSKHWFVLHCCQDEIIEDKLEQLFKTIRKIERLFAKCFAPNTFLQMGRTATAAKDIVIRANPQYPPHVLPLLCSHLQQSLKVFTSAHLHSSVRCLPNSLEDYLPMTNCDSRSKADLCITLIWINGMKELPFKRSSLQILTCKFLFSQLAKMLNLSLLLLLLPS